MTALRDPAPRGLAAWPPSPAAPTSQLWREVGLGPEADDAGLRHSLRLLGTRPTLLSRLVLLVAGCAPLVALGLAISGALPLPQGVVLLVLPTLAMAVPVGLRQPVWARRALLGLTSGVLATAVYDLWRLGLVAAGVWADPIPMIGGLLLAGEDALTTGQTAPAASGSWLVAGYLWRYLADGGGLGVAYLALPWRGARSGMLYGGLVAAGVLALLVLAPQAQTFLPLRPATAAATLAGHLIYGAVLGTLTARWLGAHARAGRPTQTGSEIPRAGRPPMRTRQMQLAPFGRDPAPFTSNGGVIALVWAGGMGCATLGVLAVAGAASEAFATAMTWASVGGRLGGSSTLAALVFLVAIPNLYVRLAGRYVDPAVGLRVTLVLIGVGLAGTFPPLQRLLGGG